MDIQTPVADAAEQMRLDILALADEVEVAPDRDALIALVGTRLADGPRQILKAVGRRGSDRLGPTVMRVAQLGWNALTPAHDAATLEQVHQAATDVAEQLRAIVTDL